MKVGPIESLGEYLREQRRNAELSVRQLAERAGVSNPYISQIERGLRKPSAEVLSQLAKALRVSAEAVYVRAGLLDPDETTDPAGETERTGATRAAGTNGRSGSAGRGSAGTAGKGSAARGAADTDRAEAAEAADAAGAAEAADAGGTVRAAIRSDAGLTRRQRQTLLEIYESFRRETAQAVAEGVREKDVRDTDAPDAPGGEGHRGQAVRRPRGAQRRRANRQED